MPSMIRRLTSAPKPSARLAIIIRTSGARLSSPGIPGRKVRCAVAVDRAVVTGQVARALRRSDDVIGGNSRSRVRQRDLLDRRSGLLIDLDRLADWPPRPRGPDLRRKTRGPRRCGAIRGACRVLPDNRGRNRPRWSSRADRGPRSPSESSAVSARSWAKGPIWSSELAKAIRP